MFLHIKYGKQPQINNLLELVLFTRVTQGNFVQSFFMLTLINIMFGISCMFQCVPVVKTKWYVEALQLLPTHCNVLITLAVSLDT